LLAAQLLLRHPEMDVDEDGLISDAAFGEREARDHRIARGWRVVEARLAIWRERARGEKDERARWSLRAREAQAWPWGHLS